MQSSPISSAAAPAGRASRLAPWLLGSICLLAIGVDLLFFTGYYGSDDIEYLAAARSIWQAGRLPAEEHIGHLRLFLVGWNLLTGPATGWDAQRMSGSFVIFHAALIIVVYRLAMRLFDARVGLLSALVVGWLPIAVLYSTCIMPDIPLACLILLSFDAFERGVCAAARGERRAAIIGHAVSGVMVGLAYLTKESGLVLLLFYLAYWLVGALRGTSRRAALGRGVAFAGGFLLIFAAETIALSVLHGQPMLRLGWTVAPLPDVERVRIEKYGDNPLVRLRTLDERLSPAYLPAAAKWALCAGVLAFPLLVRREWWLWLLGLWLLTYQTWGSMRWTEYLPPSIQARYYIPVLAICAIPMCAAAVVAFDWLARCVVRVCVRRALIGMACAAGALMVLTSYGGVDRLAGKSYSTDLVGAATMALGERPASRGRKALLSETLSYRLSGVLDSPPIDRACSARPLLTRDDFETLLSAGDFEYLDVEPAGIPRTLRSNFFLDQLLHTLIRPGVDDWDAWDALADACPRWSLDAQFPESVDFGQHRLTIRSSEAYRLPLSRVRSRACELIGWGCATARAPDPQAQAVVLYEVQVRPIGAAPVGDETTSRDATAAELDVAAALAGGRLSRARNVQLSRNEHRGPRLTCSMTGDDYAWLNPPDAPGPLLALHPNAEYEIRLQVELTGEARAELLAAVFEDHSEEAALERRVRVRNGENRFRIRTGDADCQLRPVFKLFGSGVVSIERFVAVSRPEP
jgi:hypothetical protein